MKIRHVALVVLAAAAVKAAETTPPAGGDGIAAAKQDFAEIKAAGASAEQQKFTVPNQKLGLNLRERNDKIKPPPWMSQKAKPGQPNDPSGKSANWLVDAMSDKEKDSLLDANSRKTANGDRKTDTDLSATPGDLSANGNQPDSKRNPSRAEDQGSLADTRKKEAAAANNPLTAYMAAWMTPRDFELLKAGSNDGAPTTPAGDLTGATFSDGKGFLALDGARPAESTESPLTLGDPAAAFSPKQNPYLADLPAPSSPSATPSALPGPPPANITASIPGPGIVMPISQPEAQLGPKINPAMEAVQKAREDEKYFKQLKRF